MLKQLVVEVDYNGIPVVHLPIFQLWELLRLLPAGLAAISYRYQNNQAQVSFPGLSAATAQRIVDVALTKDGDLSSSETRLDGDDMDASVPT